MVAAQLGKVKFVKSLVEHGADINAEDGVRFLILLSWWWQMCHVSWPLCVLIFDRTIGRRCYLPPKKAMKT